jgi:hypothetical protein
MLTYTDALMMLSERTPQTIKDVESVYGENLLKEVAPKHEFIRYLGIGFDGLIIKGREMVNYTPEDIRYFATERQLERYYESLI